MWKGIADWFGALCITAAVAVAVFGAAEWLEGRAGQAVMAEKNGSTVVVDAGHGGSDGGAVGTETGVVEAALNLQVASRVKSLLKEQGVTVVMTREDENALAPQKQADMAARKVLLNAPGVDAVVSIHMNKFGDRSIAGPMAFYMAGSVEGQRFAQTVVDRVCDALGNQRRLANPGDYFVIRECGCPAVLVECGFLSNQEDERLLSDPAHQEKLARAIAAGTVAFLTGGEEPVTLN